MLIFYQKERAKASDKADALHTNFKPTKSKYFIGGIIMALTLGIVAVSGIITYELEKNAPDVLGK